jgi:hypothetical protein
MLENNNSKKKKKDRKREIQWRRDPSNKLPPLHGFEFDDNDKKKRFFFEFAFFYVPWGNCARCDITAACTLTRCCRDWISATQSVCRADMAAKRDKSLQKAEGYSMKLIYVHLFKE